MTEINIRALYERTYQTPEFIPCEVFKEYIEDRSPWKKTSKTHNWRGWRKAQMDTECIRNRQLTDVKEGRDTILETYTNITDVNVEFVTGHSPGRYYTGVELTVQTDSQSISQTDSEEIATTIFPFANTINTTTSP